MFGNNRLPAFHPGLTQSRIRDTTTGSGLWFPGLRSPPLPSESDPANDQLPLPITQEDLYDTPMAPFNPYTYIRCPCSELNPYTKRTPDVTAQGLSRAAQDDDDHTFDPRAARSNYSLYPLEYLSFCEDCHQIRCPRCVAEEIVCYYCPNCLFEVPSSNIRSEGSRCTRSCFQCPICIGPLAVNHVETPPDPNQLLSPDHASSSHLGSYILSCSYCNWSSTEIGIKFDKPNSIHMQLAKLRNGGETRLTAKERKERRKEQASQGGGGGGSSAGQGEEDLDTLLDMETQFANLKSFYQNQLSDANGTGKVGGDPSAALGNLGFDAPASLSRIMSLYTGSSSLHDKKSKSRPGTMREALAPSEGLQLASLDESSAITALQDFESTTGLDAYSSTASTTQLQSQAPYLGASPLHGLTRFTSSLRPIPYLLRTKRSKRCPQCRHIISKPESKVTTTRFRIRLIAGNYIPTITIKQLIIPGLTPPSMPNLPPDTIEPLKPAQFVLTFKNPIFESVRVTLATPATTPGRFPAKVTILCPQFEIDSNTDVWEEALKDNNATSSSSQSQNLSSSTGPEGSGPGGRKRAGTLRPGTAGGASLAGEELGPEVGKVWERGRNWTSIVIEVIPASLVQTAKRDGRGPIKEDEDVLEIPMFVRIEWEAEAPEDEIMPGLSSAKGGNKDGGKEKRELAYWCVLGLGRVARTL
ncbi:dynactin p62 family domain-containing protein [Neurospora intermedia]|uniref:Dynactin subunit 4 n=1 Tax=Neurospora intermedia TaxID=5142 RepID=A0ABR3DL12_NEUIN